MTLFERVGKRLVLTAGGAGMLEHARQMAAAADALALTAAGQSSDVAGRVSLSVTDAIATHVMPDIVARLRDEVPQITIVVTATDALSDLRRREADIAIRHVRPTEPELIGRLIGELTAHLYASESWVARHGVPQSVADLRGATLLAFDPVERFVAHMEMLGLTFGLEQCRVVSNSALALWEMTRRGLGVGVVLDVAAAPPAGDIENARADLAGDASRGADQPSDPSGLRYPRRGTAQAGRGGGGVERDVGRRGKPA